MKLTSWLIDETILQWTKQLLSQQSVSCILCLKIWIKLLFSHCIESFEVGLVYQQKRATTSYRQTDCKLIISWPTWSIGRVIDCSGVESRSHVSNIGLQQQQRLIMYLEYLDTDKTRRSVEKPIWNIWSQIKWEAKSKSLIPMSPSL